MHRIAETRYLLFPFIALFVIVSAMLLLRWSDAFSAHPTALSIGITADLLLTAPLVYFLLIRKTKVPNTTVVPVFILGITLATLIIPKDQQFLLSLAKTWVVPVVEVGVLILIIRKVRKMTARLSQAREADRDFFSALNKVCSEVLPPKMAPVLANEIAILYYGFVDWKRSKPGPTEFTSHKQATTSSLLFGVLLMVAVEVPVLHILLQKWSSLAAWILTILSIYSGLQILGILKSLPRRFTVIRNGHLVIRQGILSESSIPIEDILSVSLSSREIDPEEDIEWFSPLRELDSHNVILTLKRENEMTQLYGFKRSFRKLALHIDEKEEFKREVERLLSVSEESE